MTADTPVPVRPAATVVLLRDRPAGIEVLMVRRNADLAFHGGSWVFPGGRVDDEDAGSDDLWGEAAGRRAAAREALEEAGLVVDPDALVPFSHWTTPEGQVRRFATWFFAGVGDDGQSVTVDGGEIHDHAWRLPADVLADYHGGDVQFSPPTYLSLVAVAQHARAVDALAAFAADPVAVFAPRLAKVDGGVVSMYAEDAGYATSDPTAAGPRHRFWMRDGDRRYERSAEVAAPFTGA